MKKKLVHLRLDSLELNLHGIFHQHIVAEKIGLGVLGVLDLGEAATGLVGLVQYMSTPLILNMLSTSLVMAVLRLDLLMSVIPMPMMAVMAMVQNTILFLLWLIPQLRPLVWTSTVKVDHHKHIADAQAKCLISIKTK